MRLLREELQLLQEQGSYVGEVVRAMDKKKVLVKVLLSPPPPLKNKNKTQALQKFSGQLEKSQKPCVQNDQKPGLN